MTERRAIFPRALGSQFAPTAQQLANDVTTASKAVLLAMDAEDEEWEWAARRLLVEAQYTQQERRALRHGRNR